MADHRMLDEEERKALQMVDSEIDFMDGRESMMQTVNGDSDQDSSDGDLEL